MLVEQHRSELNEICRTHGVQLLELFGSAAHGAFDPLRSDLDFLVLFDRTSAVSPADQYLGVLEELEQLFGRSIDLVDVRGARNPYFIASALKQRVRLYAA